MARDNFDDDDRQTYKKHKPKHARNIPGRGMRVINSYDEDDYEDDDDLFDDDIGVYDEISITHIKNTR